ncbi:hypothetical protein MmiAt1_02150 [Methanimicrococcus sp. At1]|uniref:Bro-N domain-containing protein n=1 Tax=Methanimicrococcus hacksteinii TaxID=3028293 RepID=A0ABU3VNB4_9EURY|nr:DNA damage-inducible protein D [Methanimicrococcus sp. At1]MDV0444681.1 hypothetical protein [Methanimicrococcus sp. At1]
MKKDAIRQLKDHFDKISRQLPEEDVEFWFARDLMKPLGYSRWENFKIVVGKAAESCKTAGVDPNDHFRDVTKMVRIGSKTERPIEDFMLTRYACYLVAQNGDPRKENIAFAQSYFAVQTRKQELIEERMKLQTRMNVREKLRESEKTLSQNIYDRGVDEVGFGRIRSAGDAALFGGNTTQIMKAKYGIIQTRPLADFLPALTIAAKNLATEMTNYNVLQEDLQGESSITSEHIQNNEGVRDMLGQRGIKPEDLPPEEDIKKSERKVKAERKKLEKESGKLPER